MRAEHEERETERPHAGGAARVAAYDRDPDDIVEAAREHEARDRGASARGRERQRSRPLIGREQALPAERLEPIADERERARRHQQAWMAVGERPRGLGELARGEHGDDDRNRPHESGEDEAAVAREREPKHA